MPKNLTEWLNLVEQLSATSMNFEDFFSLVAQLGLRNFNCPIITVAGTNGKGSCVAFLESILLHSGLRVGAFTSPHLLKFNERIRIDGYDIDDESLCRAFAFLWPKLKDNKINYFVFMTLVAFYIFSNLQLDVLILEVGIGGRIDPVNVLDSDIAVISTIDIDHVDRLGKDRETIGGEKAGIIRKERPVVVGDSAPPLSVINMANKLSAPIYCLFKDFTYEIDRDKWSWASGDLVLKNLPLTKLPLIDASTALMVIKLLQNQFAISSAAIFEGLYTAYLPGRMQTIVNEPQVILDVAHNGQAARYLAQHLNSKPVRGKTYAVVGILADKLIAEVLSPLIQIVDAWWCADLVVSRGSQAKELAAILSDFNVNAVEITASVYEAYKKALSKAEKQDRIIIYGSFYTVAQVLVNIKKEK